ncbi:MAG: hypothetical protein R6U62_06225 [Bacteroidales bacterium]
MKKRAGRKKEEKSWKLEAGSWKEEENGSWAKEKLALRKRGNEETKMRGFALKRAI